MSKPMWPGQIGLCVLLIVIILFTLTNLITLNQDAQVSAAQPGTITTLTPLARPIPESLSRHRLIHRAINWVLLLQMLFLK